MGTKVMELSLGHPERQNQKLGPSHPASTVKAIENGDIVVNLSTSIKTSRKQSTAQFSITRGAANRSGTCTVCNFSVPIE